MASIRSLTAWVAGPLAIVSLCLVMAACGGDANRGVTVGAIGGGAGAGGDAGTLGDVPTGADSASGTDSASSSGDGTDVGGRSGGGTDSVSSSGGGVDASDSSGGGVDAGGSSGGGADASSGSGSTLTWPAGPEDKLTGVDPSKAKYTTCDKAWTCALTACQFAPTKGCMDVCLNASSKAVVSEMMDYVKCFSHICHDQQCKSGDKKCISDCAWSRCAGFAMKCNAAKKSGDKLCGTAYACFDSCKGAGVVQCLAACYVDLAKPAQQDFTDLWICLAKDTSNTPFIGCINKALDCVSGGITGKNSCLEISTCDSACKPDAKGDKFACTAKCYGQGTPAAQSQFGGLTNCVVKASQSGAVAADCGESVAVCAGAKPDGTKGALGCQDISLCEQKCQPPTGKDDSCTMKCLGQATVSEASKWWNQAMCWGACGKTCGVKSGATCVQDCFVKTCKKESTACLGL